MSVPHDMCRYLTTFVEKQLCTSDRNGATSVLLQTETGEFCASDTTRDVGRGSSVGIATRYGLDGPGIEA